MLPAELKPEDFRDYPPEAKKLAVEHIALLRQLPLVFLSLSMRELREYDWKFPAERRDIEGQFAYLGAKNASELTGAMEPFARLQLTKDLANSDWINDPTGFSEKLSASLWATHQMDAFRKASIDYIHGFSEAQSAKPLATGRLTIVLIGQGAGAENRYALFRKLRPRGVHYTNLDGKGGREAILACLKKRAARYGEPFAHWYVDGGDGLPSAVDGVASVAYADLQPIRVAIVNRMVRTMKPGGGGPEALRTQLASLRPADLGLPEAGRDGLLNRFQLSLLTQGSGTQLFSTTFVQWTAREVLRRAQPLTLVARFMPRQRDTTIHEVHEAKPPVDVEGSLIDADMGAYYTWLNGQRLPQAEQSRFAVWFEEHGQAVVCAPGMKAGSEENRTVGMGQLLSEVLQV